MAPLELADALVAIAKNNIHPNFDDAVIAVVDQAWSTLLGSGPRSRYEGMCAHQHNGRR